METDRTKWNVRHGERMGHHPPDAYMVRFVQQLSAPVALDVACGRGRNSFFLAENGFQVTAIDISDTGLSILSQEAKSRNLAIKTIEADLDLMPESLAGCRFNTIIIINYRPATLLLHKLPGLLYPDGTLLWCSFNEKQSQISAFPPGLALHPEEFTHFFDGLELIDYSRFAEESGERDGYFFKKTS
jgi:2-polyprenyl-3-methyl-5-hydroxy-6-metoxy-1,4-benzoquinol methylase